MKRLAGGCLFLLLLLLALVAGACMKEATTEEATAAKPAAAGRAAEAGGAARNQGGAGKGSAGTAGGGTVAAAVPARRLVRTVELDLTVAHTTEAAEAARALAARLGGYVASLNATRSENLMEFRMTLCVPVERLDAALAELKRGAVRIDREEQKTEDVTDQFVDLDARLRSLRATDTELQALLAESRQRQRGVKDIMEVYGQMTEIRTKIEEIQGRMQVLDKLAALSTVVLRLSAPEAARPLTGEGWQPMAAVHDSVRALVGLLRFVGNVAIYGLIVLVPAILLLAAFVQLVRGGRRLARRLGLGRRPPPPQPTTTTT